MRNHSKNVSLHNTLRNYIKQNTNTYIRHTFFSSFQIIHKISFSLWFWAPDLFFDWIYYNLLIKGSGAKKQRLNEIL